jgi:N-acetyl-anhydromuramyl-L-alanine amidase AmpD
VNRIYPGASVILTPEAMQTGKFKPAAKGVTVHYTGDPDVERVNRTLLAAGLGYHLVIGKDGRVYQFTYLDGAVAHAGKAMWCGLSPNRTHIAIALASWGFLIEDPQDSGSLMSWSGAKLKKSEARERHGLRGGLKWWDHATAKQETALLVILKWMVGEGIEKWHVCGHDECAIPLGRKVDPGGVLTRTMSQIRVEL